MAFVTSIWEISLPTPIDALTAWLSSIRARWPHAVMTTHGSFGEAWRKAHPSNDWKYEFVEMGSGIGGSDADKETHWYVTPEFRLVFLRNISDTSLGQVIDFTRYDLPAAEPTKPSRSWNLMNVLNMKQTRAQDTPRPLQTLDPTDQALIKAWYPALFPVTAP